MDGNFEARGAGAPVIRDDFIPADAYLSPELVKLEKERLWPKVWQMACRVEEIPKVGDFVNYKICDDSILITRTAEDRIQAFYNVCQHRGRKLRDEEKGHASQWFCRFHGWRWTLEGKNTYVHDREDWTDHGCPLNDDDIALKQVKVAVWAGWVWINQDPDSESLDAHLGDVKDMLDPFAFEDARMSWYETIIAPVNWKVVCEAFNEGYHSMATHASRYRSTGGKTPGQISGRHGGFYGSSGKGASVVEYLEASIGQWKTSGSVAETMWALARWQYEWLYAMTLDPGMEAWNRLKEEAGPDTPPMELFARQFELHREAFETRGVAWPEKMTMEAIARAGTDWHIFPNSIVLPTVDGALWYRVRPNRDDPDSCVFDIWCLGRYAPGKEPKITRGQTVGFEPFRGKNPFLEEDFANMEAVHEGMKSRGYTGSRLNPHQERQIANFHRALQEQITEPG
jgi:phenylpropionate dioxygenase-like ring-hydroxylating dioxygenase large terminal subunit